MKSKIYYFYFVFAIFFFSTGYAQEKTIKGTVSDDTGPLPGVSVLIKGTTTGTETDFDGNYQINSKVGDVLVFSFVGMNSQERTVGSSDIINVKLKANNVLEEVVVIGYGQVSQRDLTTNVSKVKPAEVQSISTANLAGALQGTASGVQITQSSGAPGGEVRIRVRGSSSINGSNNPLFVIDGVPMFSQATISDSFGGQQNSALTNLNPDDIESIQILKDAASSAIYGDRGSNGVVIITTKKGKKGKARFNISTSVGFQTPIDKYETMNYGEWLQFGDVYYENSGFGSGFWSTLWDGRQDFRGLPQSELNTFYNSVQGQGDNYLDFLYIDDAAVINTNFNVSGGNDETQYYLGISHFDQEGTLLNQDFDRRTVRLNITQKLSEKLKFVGGISLTDENQQIVQSDNNIFGALSTAILEAPGNNIRNEDGTFDAVSWTFSNPIQNAVEDLNLGYSFRILANADFQYNISDNLFLNTNFGFDQLNFRERQYNPPTTAQGAPLGYAREDKDTYRRIKLLQSIAYNPKITEEIDLRAYLGAEWERNTTNLLRADANGFTSPLLRFLNEASTPLVASSSFSEEKRVSIISRLGLTFWDQLILEFSMRADASSKFNADNRWGFFPAASFGYIVSENDWFQNEVVSYLKLRSSWGLTGNTTALTRYASQPAVASDTYTTQGTSFLTQANPFISWEETTQYDIGFEAKFFNNRVGLNYAYFNKTTNDDSLILNVPNAISQGGSDPLDGSIPQNVGEIKNEGHEIDITANILASETSGGLNWNTTIGISFLDNEVVSLGGTSPFDTGFVSRVEEGAPLGAFRLLESNGLYQNDAEVPSGFLASNPEIGAGDVSYIDQNGDGLLNDEDFIIAGKPWADYTINWKNDFTFKGFDLGFLWALSEGNDVFNNNLQFGGASGNRLFGKFRSQLNYWTPTNTNTTLPRPNLNTQGWNNQDATRFLEDGSFIKLRNITLGYTFSKIEGFDRIRIYVSGDNLILITDYSGVDPEVNFNGAPGVTGGTDFLTQGANKVWKFGVNVSF